MVSKSPPVPVSPEMDARATQFLVGMTMVAGGLAGAFPSGGTSLLLSLKGLDEIQAAGTGNDTMVYNGGWAVGLPPAAARTVDIAAGMPEIGIGMARGLGQAASAVARGEVLVTGEKIAAEGIEAAAKGAAENPEEVALGGARRPKQSGALLQTQGGM